MAEELKELIAKIQEEGVKTAQMKAAEIDREARQRAEERILKAEKDAQRIVAEAKEQAARTEESGRQSLKQASRDTIIALKKEIAATLDRIISAHVHKALSADELAAMLVTMIKGCGGPDKNNVIISLRKDDLEKVERTLLTQLGAEAKKGITLKSSADMRGGFTVSYDGGKSHYDFTEKALAEYLSSRLNPYLSELLKDSVSGERE